MRIALYIGKICCRGKPFLSDKNKRGINCKRIKKMRTKKNFRRWKENLREIPGLESNRRKVDPEGILEADLVFVPLEDGDRTIALKKMNKKIITVDLNPLSRTSVTADISIVDNIVRAVPQLIKCIEYHKKNSTKKELQEIIGML